MLHTHVVRFAFCMMLLALLALSACTGTDHAASSATGARKATARAHYVAVARGRVDIEGGLLELHARASGTVSSVAVHEGDSVHKGQTLATLDATAARANLTIAQAQVAQAKAHAAVLQDRARAAHKNASTLERAAREGAGAHQDALAARQHAAQLKAMHSEAAAQLDVARGQLAIAQHQVQLRTLTAPLDARVTRVHIQPGSMVSAQSAAAFQLMPKRARIIRAELNQEYVEAVHKGMRAEVVLDSNHQQVLGTAHVLRVGDIFSRSRLQDNPALSAGTRTVQCVLTFDKPVSVRIGQLVLVRILATTAGPHPAKGS